MTHHAGPHERFDRTRIERLPTFDPATISAARLAPVEPDLRVFPSLESHCGCRRQAHSPRAAGEPRGVLHRPELPAGRAAARDRAGAGPCRTADQGGRRAQRRGACPAHGERRAGHRDGGRGRADGAPGSGAGPPARRRARGRLRAQPLGLPQREPASFRRAEEVRYTDRHREGRAWSGYAAPKRLTPATGEAALAAFKATALGLFGSLEGHCEIYRRTRPSRDAADSELFQLTLYRDDLPVTYFALEGGHLVRRHRRPVVEVSVT